MEQTFLNNNCTIEERCTVGGTSQSNTEMVIANGAIEQTVEQAAVEASGGRASLKLEDIREKLVSNEFKTQKRVGSKYHSSNWNIYHEIVSQDGTVIPNYVVCTNCNKLQRYEPEKGTNNLTRHMKACTMPKNTLKRYLVKSSISLDKADKDGILNASKRFCYQDLRPFQAIQGEGLVDLLHAISAITAHHGLLSKEQIKEIVPNPKTVSSKNQVLFFIKSIHSEYAKSNSV